VKEIVSEEYGSAEVLRYTDVEKPASRRLPMVESTSRSSAGPTLIRDTMSMLA
jgi:hypothetical protein